MPLNNSETKALLVNLFRLSISITEKRTEDALEAYSNIIDVAFPLVKEPEIDLIISEIPEELPSTIDYESDSAYPKLSLASFHKKEERDLQRWKR